MTQAKRDPVKAGLRTPTGKPTQRLRRAIEWASQPRQVPMDRWLAGLQDVAIGTRLPQADNPQSGNAGTMNTKTALSVSCDFVVFDNLPLQVRKVLNYGLLTFDSHDIYLAGVEHGVSPDRMAMAIIERMGFDDGTRRSEPHRPLPPASR